MAAAELKSDNPILLAKERIAAHVYGTSRVASGVVARRVAELVKVASADKPLVLGLSIDSALGAVYEELVRLHREEQLSFQHVHAFVLHEYHGLAPHMQELQSFQAFLQQYLLDHVDIAPGTFRRPISENNLYLISPQFVLSTNYNNHFIFIFIFRRERAQGGRCRGCK
jgi:6-phosphogluconolactonase/glucosamine-6-phosphate isomerase/deaminase